LTPDSTALVPAVLSLPGGLPALITAAGERTAWRFVEFFTATIRNPHTREAYARAVGRFLAWCEGRGLRDLRALTPVAVAAYIEQLPASRPTVKQHLAAIRQCLDYLVTGGILDTNPAASVRGPTYVIKKGKTPVLDTEQTRALLDAIDTRTIVGLRDRALIGVMVYSFARVSAVIGMRVEDYYPHGKRWWFRLHEKGGKYHEVPAHHKAEEFMDAYVKAAGLAADLKGPLFRTVNRAPAYEAADAPQRRHPHGQAAGPEAQPAAWPLLPYVPGHRHHGLSGERRHHRARSADRRSRKPQDHQALRPHQRPDHPR
jgi:site-specific recombinase XerC